MRPRLLLLAAACIAFAGCGSSPDSFAKKLETTLAAGDPDALLAMVDTRGVPGTALFFMADTALDCSREYQCSVAVLSDPKAVAEHAGETEEGTAFRVAPEGIIHVAGRKPGEPADKKAPMNLHVPFAKVDGEYKLLTAGYTEAKIAALKETTPAAAADEILALGVHDDELGARDLQWKDKATPLPAGGGEPGAAFLADVETLNKALASGSVKAVVDATGAWGEAVFASVDYDGKPVAEEFLKRKIKTQQMRFVTEAKVLGGYERGDFAALVIEGRNGRGDTIRGAQFMQRVDGKWERSANSTVAIPVSP